MGSASLSPENVFRKCAPAELLARLGTPEQLASLLEAVLARARGAWPGIDLDSATFLRHLAGKLEPGSDLDKVQVEHLFLACACLQEDPRAFEVLDREFLLKIVPAALVRSNLHAQAEDVLQLLRQKLLVTQGESPPRIGEYSGRGSLAPWIRVAALRVAQDLERRRRPEVSQADEALAEIPSPVLDAEMELLKSRFGKEFKQAFQEALQTLGSRERNILHLQFVEGLTPDEIGRIYKAHRVTVWRWIAKIREELVQTTRKLLAERLPMNDSEFEHLIALVRSQVDVSINSLLKK